MDGDASRSQSIAGQILASAGYEDVSVSVDAPSELRVWENEYGVVAVADYRSPAELLESWGMAQDSLLSLIREHLSHDEPKSLEGYLVLLFTGEPSTEEASDLSTLSSDTTYVRKLVNGSATGHDPATIGDVLRPLLPLHDQLNDTSAQGSIGGLVQALSESDADRELWETVIHAAEAGSSMMTAICEFVGED